MSESCQLKHGRSHKWLSVTSLMFTNVPQEYSNIFQPTINSLSMLNWPLTIENRNVAHGWKRLTVGSSNANGSPGQNLSWRSGLQPLENQNVNETKPGMTLEGTILNSAEFGASITFEHLALLTYADIKPSDCSHSAVHHLPPTSWIWWSHHYGVKTMWENPATEKNSYATVTYTGLAEMGQDVAPVGTKSCRCQVTEFLLEVLPDIARGISHLSFFFSEKDNAFTQILPTTLKQDTTNVCGGVIDKAGFPRSCLVQWTLWHGFS